MKKAADILGKAITLHAAHMDGSEPTTEKSQEKLMALLEAARCAELEHKRAREMMSGHEKAEAMMGKGARMAPKR